jgi:uncharacterized peroxidase-related enzyme
VSWIETVAPETAPEPLRNLMARIGERQGAGQVGMLWRACSLDPAGLAGLFELVRALMDRPEPLSRAQAELIAVTVSATNGCGYCVAHHGPKLAAALGDEALAHAVARDWREADLPARDRVLADHAVALTCEPAERTAGDVERLREYGFDDAAILRATEIAALFNLINRIANGLGVALEEGIEPWSYGGA